MSLHAVTRLILRVAVVTLAFTAINHYKQSQAVAELEVSPLWDPDANTSLPCTFHGDEDKRSFNLHGSPSDVCQVRVSATNDNSAISVQFPNQTSEHDFLYVEFMEVSKPSCLYRFIVIDGRDKPCEAVISHQKLQFNLQGDASLLITEISARKSPMSTCYELDDEASLSEVSLTLPNCSVTPYHDALTCAEKGSHICRFDFPFNCNATLGFKEVTFNCYHEYY